VDIVAALIQQRDYQTARKYWNKLKERLKKEGSQSVTNCHQLKLSAEEKLKEPSGHLSRRRPGEGEGPVPQLREEARYRPMGTFLLTTALI